jgi:hypothetical protein
MTATTPETSATTGSEGTGASTGTGQLRTGDRRARRLSFPFKLALGRPEDPRWVRARAADRHWGSVSVGIECIGMVSARRRTRRMCLQETWLRWADVDLDTVRDQRAYPVRINHPSDAHPAAYAWTQGVVCRSLAARAAADLGGFADHAA